MGSYYAVLHIDIDGAIEDRESGWPELSGELHPIGTLLPKEQQVRELHLKIGRSKTVLDEKGIAALRAFLDLKP